MLLLLLLSVVPTTTTVCSAAGSGGGVSSFVRIDEGEQLALPGGGVLSSKGVSAVNLVLVVLEVLVGTGGIAGELILILLNGDSSSLQTGEDSCCCSCWQRPSLYRSSSS